MCGILGGVDSLASVDLYALLIASGLLLEGRGIIGGGEIVIGACCTGNSETSVKERVVLLDCCLWVGCWLPRGWRGNSSEATAGDLEGG